MKKSAMFVSALAAVFASGVLSVTALAATNPADDAAGYSYNAGRQAYESRMAEDHPWYDNKPESVTGDYSFNTGAKAAQSRSDAFAEMPAGDAVTKEEVEAWFRSRGIGEGSAWSDGSYDEAAKSGYGYQEGQAAYEQYHAAFGKEGQ